MTSLPVPYVVALAILILALANHHQLKESATGRLFAVVLYINALSMVLIGLRWSYDLVRLLPLVATLSIISSVLLYLAFRSLGRRGPVISVTQDWLHLIPVVLVAISALLLLTWVDVVLAASKLLYTGLLLQLARRMPDSVQMVRLSWLRNTQQALWGAAALLLFSVTVDIGIAIDFALYNGRHAANLVGWVSMLVLLLLGWAVVLAGRGRVDDHDGDTLPGTAATSQSDDIASNSDDAALLDTLNRLLVDNGLYADTELNLQRLARKAGVPARTVSRVINAQTGQNLSQWVNQARINAVCTLLTDSNVSVSEAMLEAGFLTKSNFNREFRRIKGCSPSEWRATVSR